MVKAHNARHWFYFDGGYVRYAYNGRPIEPAAGGHIKADDIKGYLKTTGAKIAADQLLAGLTCNALNGAATGREADLTVIRCAKGAREAVKGAGRGYKGGLSGLYRAGVSLVPFSMR